MTKLSAIPPARSNVPSVGGSEWQGKSSRFIAPDEEADRTSIKALTILVLCKRLWTVGSVAGHTTCLGQAKALADAFM
jgi:hypothetical protein